MWPWEHALLGYLAYSLISRAYYRTSPGESDAIAVAVASVLPDAIDKPLAWQFGLFPSGYAVAHSAFVAVPVAIAAGLLARRYGRGRLGAAFGVGYLFHLVGDVVPIYVRYGRLSVDHLRWPVVVHESVDVGHGFAGHVLYYFALYARQLLAFDPTSSYALVQLGIAALSIGLWTYDGAPGLRTLYLSVRRPFAALSRRVGAR